MICCKCEQDLRICYCDDIEQRIEDLRKSQFLSIDWDAILAVRLLNKFEIDRLREQSKKP